MAYSHGRHLQGWKNARRQFEIELLSCADGVNKAAQHVFTNAGNSFLDFVQANKDVLPYYTANLHDSIAVAVAQSGRVVRALYMPQEATRPQNAPDRKKIWGMDEAIRAVRKNSYPKTGVSGTLFVAVPYAEGVNEKPTHRGYLETLEGHFANQMQTSIQVLKYIKVHPGAKPAPAVMRRFK